MFAVRSIARMCVCISLYVRCAPSRTESQKDKLSRAAQNYLRAFATCAACARTHSTQHSCQIEKQTTNGRKRKILSSLCDRLFSKHRAICSCFNGLAKRVKIGRATPHPTRPYGFINSINWMITSFPYTNLCNNIQLMCHRSVYSDDAAHFSFSSFYYYYSGFLRRRRCQHISRVCFTIFAFHFSALVPHCSFGRVRESARASQRNSYHILICLQLFFACTFSASFRCFDCTNCVCLHCTYHY